jgi:hypothetical protein
MGIDMGYWMPDTGCWLLDIGTTTCQHLPDLTALLMSSCCELNYGLPSAKTDTAKHFSDQPNSTLNTNNILLHIEQIVDKLFSSIQHPASSIQHPASSIQHPASSIQNPAPSIPEVSGCRCRATSFI